MINKYYQENQICKYITIIVKFDDFILFTFTCEIVILLTLFISINLFVYIFEDICS